MNNLVVMSLFRDCESAVQRSIIQFDALQWPYGTKTMVAVENDSKDHTKILLHNWTNRDDNMQLVSDDYDFPKYGSIVSLERFRNLSFVFNKGLDFILKKIPAKYVMFIESDLIYQFDLAIRLKETVDTTNGIAAPMVFTIRDRAFYDIWGYRYRDGTPFNPNTENWYKENFSGVIEVQSAGSCLMFTREVLKKGIRPDDEALVGFCKQADSKGYQVYVDFSVTVEHPQ